MIGKLWRKITSSSRNTLLKWAGDRTTNPQFLELICAVDDPDVINSALRNPSLDSKALDRLAGHSNDSVRVGVAEHQHCSLVTLVKLTQDPESVVARSALNRLAISEVASYRMVAAKNPQTSQHTLNALRDDSDLSVRIAATRTLGIDNHSEERNENVSTETPHAQQTSTEIADVILETATTNESSSFEPQSVGVTEIDQPSSVTASAQPESESVVDSVPQRDFSTETSPSTDTTEPINPSPALKIKFEDLFTIPSKQEGIADASTSLESSGTNRTNALENSVPDPADIEAATTNTRLSVTEQQKGEMEAGFGSGAVRSDEPLVESEFEQDTDDMPGHSSKEQSERSTGPNEAKEFPSTPLWHRSVPIADGEIAPDSELAPAPLDRARGDLNHSLTRDTHDDETANASYLYLNDQLESASASTSSDARTERLESLAPATGPDRALTDVYAEVANGPNEVDPDLEEQEPNARLDDDPPITVNYAELVDQLFAKFDERSNVILHERVFASKAATLAHLGDVLDVTRERVRQLEKKILRKLRYYLVQERFRQIKQSASRLQQTLGNAFPDDTEMLERVFTDLTGIPFTAKLFRFHLWLAGPFSSNQSIYWNAGEAQTLKNLKSRVADEAAATETGITHETMLDLFDDLGIRPEFADQVIKSLKLQKYMGRYFTYRLGAEFKTYLALQSLNRPATIEELASLAEFENMSIRGIRSRIMDDDRFIRVNKDDFALREWGLTEYAGIVDAIVTEIDQAGGSAVALEIIEKLPQIFGVSTASVRTYLQAPMFVNEGDRVRLRREDEPYEIADKLSKRPSVFAARNMVSFTIEVDSEVLRGSGEPLTPDVTKALGVTPGMTRTFRQGEGTVAVSWPMTSATGGNLGSIRDIVAACSASVGQNVRLTFNLDTEGISASIVRDDYDSPLEALRDITGFNFSTPEEAEALLDEALDFPFSGIVAALQSRGDLLVAEYLTRLGITI